MVGGQDVLTLPAKLAKGNVTAAWALIKAHSTSTLFERYVAVWFIGIRQNMSAL